MQRVRRWVAEVAATTRPQEVVWCDGSDEEYQRLIARMLADGNLIELNHEAYPGCYLHRSNPNDVARSEHLTFICTPSPDTAGVTNNWMETKAAYAKLRGLLDGDPDRRYICHFPYDNAIWSVGSGYGGNALLGKKCLALRIASFLGHQQGWMAEHMLISGVKSPTGEKTYVAA